LDNPKALYARLKREGVDVWLDKEKLLPGQDWKLEIEKVVNESDVVIVCLSKQFNQEGFRQKEVRWALDKAMEKPEGEIFIIPARLEECEILKSLSRWHWVDLFAEDGYEMLMRALRARADTISAVLPDTQPPRKWNTQIIIATIAVIIFIVFAAIFGLPWKQWFPAAPDNVTVTPTNTIISTPPSPIVPMSLVPAGTFTMGEDSEAHTVDLNAFYIDKYEVTNVLYKACEDAGGCTPPQNTSSYTHSSYYGNSEFDDYPVIYVDWNQAKAYCEWRGASLPTEAQWEKAARGTDARTYPWGEGINCERVNHWGEKSCVGDTTPVGYYDNGTSPYGIYDLAGNVWEWTSSLYKTYPYDASDGREDLNSSDSRVLRGGSWNYGDDDVRSALRYGITPSGFGNNIGFRCADSP
jgi:hypothetical protein